jgi:hypothetical protein
MHSTGSDGILDGTFSLCTGGPGYQLHLQVAGDQGGSVHLPGILQLSISFMTGNYCMLGTGIIALLRLLKKWQKCRVR